MNTIPTLDELRDLHRRATYYACQAMFQDGGTPFAAWLYSANGKPNTHPLHKEDYAAIFSPQANNLPEARLVVMSLLVRSYLVDGGTARSALASQGKSLPRAIILVVPPTETVDGEVVKTFVLTEYQVFLAESLISERGKAVKLADLELLDASLAHNRATGPLN
jgi:hypothetical protein